MLAVVSKAIAQSVAHLQKRFELRQIVTIHNEVLTKKTGQEAGSSTEIQFLVTVATTVATAAAATTTTVAATAITTTATATTEATCTWLHWASFVANHVTAINGLAVHATDGCQCFCIAGHFHKAKAF